MRPQDWKCDVRVFSLKFYLEGQADLNNNNLFMQTNWTV